MKRSERRRLVRGAGGDHLTHLRAVFSKSSREERIASVTGQSGVFSRRNLSGTAEVFYGFRLKDNFFGTKPVFSSPSIERRL